MPQLGLPEIILVLIVVLFWIGAKYLPKMGKYGGSHNRRTANEPIVTKSFLASLLTIVSLFVIAQLVLSRW